MFFVWIGYLHAIGYGLEEAIWINMDETPIPYHTTGRKGMRKHATSKQELDTMRDKVALTKIRTKCTLIASICSDTTVQQHLPQVFLPNEKGIVKKWKAAAETLCDYHCIRMLRGTSGWIRNDSFKKYVRILNQCLKEHAPGKKIVLMMDAHSTHMSVQSLKLIRKLNWRVIFVPSKATFLLQPLDAYIFSTLKHRLHVNLAETRMNTSDGVISFASWAATTFSTVNSLFQNMSPKTYFEKCGCSIPTSVLSQSIWKCVEHVDIGKYRKFTGPELSSYMGSANALHMYYLFRDPIPPSFRDRHIPIRAPTHRLTSKRSFQSLAS